MYPTITTQGAGVAGKSLIGIAPYHPRVVFFPTTFTISPCLVLSWMYMYMCLKCGRSTQHCGGEGQLATASQGAVK